MPLCQLLTPRDWHGFVVTWQWDTMVSSFILKNACDGPDGGTAVAGQEQLHACAHDTLLCMTWTLGTGDTEDTDGAHSGSGGAAATARWPMAKLQAYIAHVKEQFKPVLTTDAEAVLTRYYQMQRSTDTRSQARTTLRLLESLVRLTQVQEHCGMRPLHHPSA